MWQSINPSVLHFLNQDPLVTSLHYSYTKFVSDCHWFSNLYSLCFKSLSFWYVFPRLTQEVLDQVGAIGSNNQTYRIDLWFESTSHRVFGVSTLNCCQLVTCAQSCAVQIGSTSANNPHRSPSTINWWILNFKIIPHFPISWIRKV